MDAKKKPGGSVKDNTGKQKVSGQKSEKTQVNDEVLVVGVGASAGGLEALEQFFRNVPGDSGIAFVVIQHLDPTHPGIMPELLQRLTSMNVFQAVDNMKVKRNTVYVIPPNKSMSFLHGTLHLFEPVESRWQRLPIDVFFRSLAEDMREKSIGIVLSGMGSDGSLGLKAIKEKNGVVLVQDPGTAKFGAMPQSALEAVHPDFIASPEELPAKLINFLSAAPEIPAGIDIDSESKSNIEKIIILLREQSGHDFSLYKKNTILRRIERRRSIHQLENIEEYVHFLQQNPQEIRILFKEMLIGVTNFFRDETLWEHLKETALPELMSTLPEDYTMRAWIPGCSTGEEAYTLSIIFNEVKAKNFKFKNLNLQIFATDLDVDAIEKARKGVFPKNIASDVSPGRLQRFFTEEDNGFRANPSIRELIVFAPQNVIKDPPFIKLDILSCRNMLIYMEQELQKKLIALFNYSINPGGILILGNSESLGHPMVGFKEVIDKIKIFRRTSTALETELVNFPSSYHKRNLIMPKQKKTPQKVFDNIQTLADQVLLQQFSPASVLVDKDGNILYITGRTGSYLEPVAGKANWNIFAMAREGLNKLLPAAFRQALQSTKPVVLQQVKINFNNTEVLAEVTIQYLEKPPQLNGMIMVVFRGVHEITKPLPANAKTGKSATSKRISELEAELQKSYEEIKSVREDHQISQEELKSMNEELQSTNEELQSTNEELTTSKEEMQSLNEELQTVNLELQSKINDHIRVNEDLTNLLDNIDVASLFLDKDLNIRRYTDKLLKIFKLREVDSGRPFTDQVHNLIYPDMEADARLVLKNLTPVESEIESTEKCWYKVKIMPYRTSDDRIDGLVMTFADITDAKLLEIQLKEANATLNKKQERKEKD